MHWWTSDDRLPDANALIALTVAEREHRDRASVWAVGGDNRPRAVRASPACEFRSDHVTHADASPIMR